jgi:predicted GNAT family acetyltransferase
LATLQDILSGNFPAAQRYAEGYAQMPSYLQDPYLGLSTSQVGNVTKGLLGSLDDVIKPYKDMGIDISAYVSKNKPELTVSKIVVPKEMRSQGIGTQVMQDITNYADQTGNKVTLTPSTSFGATSVGRLKDFYKNLGFVENKGKLKDFSTRETMYREPKGLLSN